MFFFDNKTVGYAKQSRINQLIYVRKVRTSNEYGTYGELFNIGG